MNKTLSTIAGAGALVFFVLAGCASTKDDKYSMGDYQTLQKKNEQLTQANQVQEKAIKDKDTQMVAVKQQLTDTKNIVGSKGDLQKKLVSITTERAVLTQRVVDFQAQIVILKDLNETNNRQQVAVLDQLRRSLKEEIGSGRVNIREYNGSVLVEVATNVTFDPESAVLKPDFEKTLLRLAAVFKAIPQKIIRVEGHTATFDNDKDHNSWELGANRAIRVARFFEDKGGIDPERMVVASFGKFWPGSNNSSEASRVKNRIVTFSLLDKNFYELKELREVSVK